MSFSLYLLKGQKALVAGASSSIGEAIARYLAASGAAVVVNYHSERKLWTTLNQSMVKQ